MMLIKGVNNEDFLSMVGSLIGTPFRHRGRSVVTGLDCFGVVIEVYRWYGIIVSDIWAYDEGLPGDQKIRIAESVGVEWERIDDPVVPCVCLFKWGKDPTHIGIHIGKGKFVHSLKARGQVIIERLDVEPYKKALEGYYEFRGA